jgi:mRNA interferase RelE/StbE
LSYTVELTRMAKKQLFELSVSMRRRIDRKLVILATDPYGGAVKLRSRTGFRQRTGNYRLIYEINDAERRVIVTGILHRREAYR